MSTTTEITCNSTSNHFAVVAALNRVHINTVDQFLIAAASIFDLKYSFPHNCPNGRMKHDLPYMELF